MGQVDTIGEVLAQMRQLDTELDADDGVSWFNRLYLAVTQTVVDSVGQIPERAPGFLERLDVVFANLYFEALDAAAGDGVPRGYPFHAWKPLFARRRRRDIAPIQFAIAGMNAHINHDLALAVQVVWRERGIAIDRHAPEFQDFNAVNPLLERVEADVKVWLLTGALQELDRRFGPVDDVIAIWKVTNARDAAWTNSEVLSHLRDEGALERRYREVIDRTTGAWSRALLRPVGFFEGAPLIRLAPGGAPSG
jgi:hypothetical protein